MLSSIVAIFGSLVAGAALFSQGAFAMSGMGFNNLDGWPSSGVSHVRIWDIGATWRDIHKAVDVYDWSRLDAVVNQAQSIGAKITYVRYFAKMLLKN
jgi:hypothetical protein